MKNIIVLGVARSGKSTFARMIKERLGHSIISVDSFINAFQNNYPQLGFAHHGKNNHLITPFVMSYFNSITYNHDYENFVIEGWHMQLKDVVKAVKPDTVEIVVLGYPRLTPDEVLHNVRKYEGKFDYTRAMSDEQILDVVTRHVEHSKNLQNECKELGVCFVDTSYNRPEILEETLKLLEEKVK